MVFHPSSSNDAALSFALGPILLGAFFNAIFYGALVIQALSYFQNFRKDPRSLQLFVVYLLVVETLSTGFDIGLAYEPLIVRPRAEALSTVPTMLATVGAVTVFISTPVQIYFAMRLRVVLGSYILPSVVVLFSITSFVGGILTSVNVVLHPTFPALRLFTWGPILWLSTAALTDTLITFGLCNFLYRNKSGMQQFDSVVNRIIMTTVQTGALTAIAATADFIVFISAHGTYNFIWDLALAKLYTNALLSTLNARKAWNDLVDERRSSPELTFINVEKAMSTTGTVRNYQPSLSSTQPSTYPSTHRHSYKSDNLYPPSQFRSTNKS